MAPQEPQPRVEGLTPVRGNGTAGRDAYITANDRRILYDTEARGPQRDTARAD
jgi:hypothetical protein